MARDWLVTLGDGRTGPALVALGWWLAFLAMYFLPPFLIVVGKPSPEDPLAALTAAAQLRAGLIMLAGSFAVAVVVLVEVEQWRARRRQATTSAGARYLAA